MPMALIAFIAWMITAAAGLGLVSIWIIERDAETAASRLPKTVVSAHGLLAVIGLAVWAMYLLMDADRLAWTAVAILVVVFLLGATMAVRYIRVYRAYKTPAPVLVPVGSRLTGRITGIEEPAPPERHLPIALVITHGVMATVTIALVLLTALDVFGS
jgi:manganese efflux pump family protein